MILSRSYKNALMVALALHFSIAMVLFIEPSSNKPPVLEQTQNPDMIQAQASQSTPQPEPIKAVSVDASEVMKTVNHLKEQRARQEAAERSRQQQLQKQVELARKERVLEQQRLQQLKSEAEKVAIAHKKQIEEEKKRLERVAQQKAAEEKRLAEMKKQQQEEAKKLTELKKKQDLAKAEAAKAEATKAEAKRLADEKQQEAKARADAEQKRQQAIKQAAMDAERNARIAGEVDRYKALIIGAISRQWILPDNVQNNLSSEFRIRLAPDGSVLEVSLARSSGDSVLDHSAQSAIYKASPLPVPTDPEAFNTFRDISLTVRPENARG